VANEIGYLVIYRSVRRLPEFYAIFILPSYDVVTWKNILNQ